MKALRNTLVVMLLALPIMGHAEEEQDPAIFTASAVASIASPNAALRAESYLYYVATLQCKAGEVAVRMSELHVFDVGTFFATRSTFKCMPAPR